MDLDPSHFHSAAPCILPGREAPNRRRRRGRRGGLRPTPPGTTTHTGRPRGREVGAGQGRLCVWKVKTTAADFKSPLQRVGLLSSVPWSPRIPGVKEQLIVISYRQKESRRLTISNSPNFNLIMYIHIYVWRQAGVSTTTFTLRSDK